MNKLIEFLTSKEVFIVISIAIGILVLGTLYFIIEKVVRSKKLEVVENHIVVEEMEEEGSFIGRTRYDAPEIDNAVIFTSSRNLLPGDMVKVLIQDAFDYDLVGTEV